MTISPWRRRATGVAAVAALALPIVAVLPGNLAGIGAGKIGSTIGSVVDSLAGVPPSATGDPASTDSTTAFEPVAATTTLPGADGSAGWSPLTANNADAVAARRRYAVPSPAQPRIPAGPAAPAAPQAAVEAPVRPRLLGRGPVVKQIELAPMRSCPSLNDNRQSIAMTVRPKAGGITVTYWSRGVPGVQAMRVGAEPQFLERGVQPQVVWVRQAAPQGCREVTVALSGLTSASVYRVVLMEEATSAVTGRATYRIIGRSEPIAAG